MFHSNCLFKMSTYLLCNDSKLFPVTMIKSWSSVTLINSFLCNEISGFAIHQFLLQITQQPCQSEFLFENYFWSALSLSLSLYKKCIQRLTAGNISHFITFVCLSLYADSTVGLFNIFSSGDFVCVCTKLCHPSRWLIVYVNISFSFSSGPDRGVSQFCFGRRAFSPSGFRVWI